MRGGSGAGSRAAVNFYTDNGDFFGGKTRKLSPLYSARVNVSYTLAPGCWLAVNAGHFIGGRSTVGGVRNNDEQEGTRFGVTLPLPLNKYQSVKVYVLAGYNAHREHDFKATIAESSAGRASLRNEIACSG